MENAGYLLAAFIIAWAFVFGYILLLYNKQRRLQQEIDSLKEALKVCENDPETLDNLLTGEDGKDKLQD